MAVADRRKCASFRHISSKYWTKSDAKTSQKSRPSVLNKLAPSPSQKNTMHNLVKADTDMRSGRVPHLDLKSANNLAVWRVILT